MFLCHVGKGKQWCFCFSMWWFHHFLSFHEMKLFIWVVCFQVIWMDDDLLVGWFCDGIAFISFLKGILRTANVVFCVWWFLRLLWGIELICSCLILFIFWDVFWFFETKEWIGIFYWMMFFSFFFGGKMWLTKKEKAFDKEYWMIFLIWKIKGRLFWKMKEKEAKKKRNDLWIWKESIWEMKWEWWKTMPFFLKETMMILKMMIFYLFLFFLMWNE